MGLSTAAAFAIVMGFAIVATGHLTQSSLRGQQEIADAQRDQQEASSAHATGAFAVVQRNWTEPGGQGRLQVWANNTGGVAFDAGKVDVLLDGVWRTDLVAARDVDGDAATSVWAPGEQLRLQLDDVPTPEPSRAWLVTDTGAAAVG